LVPEQSHNISDLSILFPSAKSLIFVRLRALFSCWTLDYFIVPSCAFSWDRIEMIFRNDKSPLI